MKAGDSVIVTEEARHYMSSQDPVIDATVMRRVGDKESNWYVVQVCFGLFTQIAILPDYFLKKA